MPEPRERSHTTSALGRASIAASAAAWAAAGVLIVLDNLGIRPAGREIESVTTWLMGAGALLLLLPKATGNQRVNDLISRGLNLGSPELDDLLGGGGRQRWRSIPWVGVLLMNVASVAWALSLIYSIQLGCGVYTLPQEATAEMLRLLMACAVWPTYLCVSGRSEANLRALYEVACVAHRSLRGNVVIPGLGAPEPAQGPHEVALPVSSLDDHRTRHVDSDRFGGGNRGTAGNGRVAPGA